MVVALLLQVECLWKVGKGNNARGRGGGGKGESRGEEKARERAKWLDSKILEKIIRAKKFRN